MPKKLIGTVSSDVQDKTIVVTVVRRQTHPIYKKQYTVSTKYVAHDEKNEAKKGDRVEISEARPYSKTKTWKLGSILETGHGEVVLSEEPEIVAATGVPEEKKS